MKTFKNIYLGLAAASFAALVSCAEKEENTQVVAPDPFAVQTEKFKLKIDTLYTEFINPWGMTWLPDGTMLVTERKGEILVFKDDKFTGTKLSGVPAVSEVNQAGLLDIAVHPKYAENGWIYLSYARKADKGEVLVISRAKLSGSALTDLQEIFVCNPEWEGGRHFGSRIVFDNDGYLYFSNGDKGSRPMNAQELNNDHGKIHRIHDDGRIPADNPFVNTPGASPSIWTYGNRNPQGMIYDKANNRIWAVEHGPKGGDELNLIEKGKNYGWPVISYGINYDGSILTELTEKEGMEQPVTYWVPSIATCGMALVTSDVYPEWKGNILVAGLAGMQIARVELEGTKYKSQETLLKDIGRVRQVSESPDGYIYAITEATSLLVKLVPQR
ncbi:PQQ-dependent sugar dehydrogenase [Mariniradius sediminis]|jgi:aldose sugar dehydrogenase|uniref:PQQ-dependent sugar dehydrogenase n=1 Tax=Mariniradius sediminis TaxID=2909237 RepID=A0ABS9BSH7_9BACT|nr:PQQ-dependent sugar dehydrogenase [Mariniradius sediminis]MCF1750526.1 PQQ-dependent sugar dehydrogenase [Mariniradius sediminis]